MSANGMKHQCSWTAEQREFAKQGGKVLFAAAIDGCHLKDSKFKTGRYEFAGPEDEERARIAFWFAFYLLHEEQTPEQALATVLELMKQPAVKKARKKKNTATAGDRPAYEVAPRVFTNCNVCGRALADAEEDQMGMCYLCAGVDAP